MAPNDLSDAALVIIGHGSTLNEDSGAPVFLHAAELRRRKLFAEVREGFWKQEPRVGAVATQLQAPRVFLAPLFISEGYFSEQVIPESLGFEREGKGILNRVRHRGNQILCYCRPTGTHDRMTGVLLARAREVVAQFPFPRPPKTEDITLFIAGHGTEEHENSRKAIERQAALIRARTAYAGVHAVFIEEEPRISAWFDMSRTKNIVVVPFFMSEGLHVQQDIPVLLGEPERIVKQRVRNQQPAWRNPTEQRGKLVWYAPSVGTDPLIADVILERVREASSWP